MEEKRIEKLDATKISSIYSKIDGGANAKKVGKVAIIAGLIAWALIPIILILAYFDILSFDKESTKYIPVIIFACCGLLLNTCAVYFILQNCKYQAIIRPILANGLLTEGYVVSFEFKSFRRNYQNFWHYKLTYCYADDKGITYNEKISFSTNEKKDFDSNKNISIAFYEGHSIMVEMK